MDHLADVSDLGVPARSRRVDLGDLCLHLVEAGEGPLVILLHGFPEHWRCWRLQIPFLVRAGFRVVAPDMRGYNLSDKPPRVRDYRPEALTADVARLVDALGAPRAHVVGHDWGAMVAWLFAMAHPSRLDRLAILNVAHPTRMLAGLRTPAQALRSWYVFFFQLPWLPELLCRATRYALPRWIFENDARRPGAFPPEEVERNLAALARPGALEGGIAYYRAALRGELFGTHPRPHRIDAPTLVLWGEQDRYLGPELAAPPVDLVPDQRVVRLPDASHWVQVDAPDTVNETLVGFLRPSSEITTAREGTPR